MPHLASKPRRLRPGAAYVVATIAVLSLAARPTGGPGAPNREDAAEVRRQFVEDLDGMNRKLTALANAFPADKYAWRPAPGVRSVGEVFMHLTAEYYYWSPKAFGAAASPLVPSDGSSDQLEKTATKADVLKHLAASMAYARQSLEAADPGTFSGTHRLANGDSNVISTSFEMVDDMHEHLGQLIAYARMNGVRPPWSRK